MNGEPSPPPTPSPTSNTACEICKSDDRFILHNIILTKNLPGKSSQKLCTSCVLKRFQSSLCAECFELYDPVNLNAPPLNHNTTATNNRHLTCFKCKNWSHITCPRINAPKSPYMCPPCSPMFKYFDFKRPRKDSDGGGGGGEVNGQVIDKQAAKRLLTAARISAIIMNKAAATARLEAERKVKEVALAKKRAKEAIEHFVGLAAKHDSVKERQMAVAAANTTAMAAMAVSSNGQKIVAYSPVVSERNGAPDVKNVNGSIVPVVSVPTPTPISVIMPANSNGNGGGGSNTELPQEK